MHGQDDRRGNSVGFLNKKSPLELTRGLKESGNDLLSHTVARAVPSAQEGLTSEFGMESGVAPPP